MKKYTQAEFDAIQRDEYGYKHLPSGDWTGVDFGGQMNLIFGMGCTIGEGCTIGMGCTIGEWCKIGAGCTIGEWCTIGAGCGMEGGRVQNAVFFFASNIGRENRTAYAFCNTKTGEIFVRAGCWFSNLTAFIERVKSVHGGTQHEIDYLAFVEFAKARFARYLPKEGQNNDSGRED